MSKKKVLVAVNSYGLGHATRCVPLIRELIDEGYAVSVLSCGRALKFLKNYFKDEVNLWLDQPDVPLTLAYTEKGFSNSRLIFFSPYMLWRALYLHLQFKRIQKKNKFDLILSDSRIEIFDRKNPSFYIGHILRGKKKAFQGSLFDDYLELLAWFCQFIYTAFLIPDYAQNSLSGLLSHDLKFVKPEKLIYIGHLSMIKKSKVKEDIDYFFSISGPEPSRTEFEAIVLEAVKKMPDKKIVVTLGKPEAQQKITQGNLEIHNFLNPDQQSEMMNRAKLIISKAGYTTLMDLAELGKKALLIPTDGSFEHEYLAAFHKDQNIFYFERLRELKIPESLDAASRSNAYIATNDTQTHTRQLIAMLREKKYL